jgi:hypothetical protein
VRREALVWLTRLRIKRRVGIVGNGVGFLKYQTTKRYSMALEGEGLFTVNTAGIKDRGPRRQMSYPESY